MRIHIWTASYGHGHNKAALLLQKAAEAEQHEAVICRPLEQGHTLLHQFSKKLYRGMLSFSPGTWRKFSQHVPSALFQNLRYVFQKQIREGMNADLILSVHPLLTALAGEEKKTDLGMVPIYHVATDYWQAPISNHPAVNGFFLPDMGEEIRTSYGSPVFSTGIPAEKLKQRYTRKECCLEHNFDPAKPLLFVGGGGEGHFPFQKVVEELKKIPIASTIVVVSGTKRWKEKTNSQFHDVHVLPFTHRFTDYLQAADVFITKAGGVTLTEAVLCETPMVLFAPLAGHEERNACYFAKKDAACWAFTPELLRLKVADYIVCPLERERIKRRMRRLQQPDSVNRIISIASHHASRSMLHSEINSQ